MVPDASIAFAARTLMASNAGGRPPTRPRARLAAKAIRVRSRRSSTSNCPRAAKMWRISRPVALVVSMFSCSERRPMPRAAKVSTVDRSWRIDRARRSSRATTRYISLAGEFQGGGKLRPVCSGAAHRFLEHPFAPGSMEGIDLTIRGLQIGRDAGIADQHRSLPKLVLPPRNRDEGFRTEFWDAAWRVSRQNQNQSGFSRIRTYLGGAVGSDRPRPSDGNWHRLDNWRHRRPMINIGLEADGFTKLCRPAARETSSAGQMGDTTNNHSPSLDGHRSERVGGRLPIPGLESLGHLLAMQKQNAL